MQGGTFNAHIICSSLLNTTVKELSQLVYMCMACYDVFIVHVYTVYTACVHKQCIKYRCNNHKTFN